MPIVGEIRHPIVDSLANRAVLVPSSAPIHLLTAGGTAQANPKIVTTPLLKTSKQSWAETELTNPRIALDRGKDEPGPLTVAVAAFDRPKPGAVAEPRPRLVLISSGLFAENMSLEIEPTNQDLLMNAISWLRGRNDLKGIAPKTHVALTLAADPVLRFRLIMVPTVMAVLLILGLGFSTYLARRG